MQINNLSLKKIRIIFLFFIILISAHLKAGSFDSSTQPSSSDNDYYIYKTKKYQIIFDGQYRGMISKFDKKIHHYLDTMSKFKKRTPSSLLTIVLLSDNHQISNANASLFPFPMIRMFPAGLIGLDSLSHPYWFDSVFFHELNHIFQLNHSVPLASRIRSPSGLFFAIFFNPFPNIFLPRAFMEGDSVLKESIIHHGGRLYSGFARAFVYRQIKYYYLNQHEFVKKVLINHNPKRIFSRSAEKYLHGGYIFSALARKYPHDRINKFFKINSSSSFIYPFNWNSSLFKTFKFRDVYDLTKFYFDTYYNEAYLQKSSSRSVRTQSAYCPPFSRSGDNILFLTSDARSTPSLNIYNTRTRKWTQRKMDLPIGKVFKYKNKYYSRSSKKVHPRVIYYSLFSKGHHPNKEFYSKYVEDIQDESVLHIDTRNNLESFKLFLDNVFYDEVNSNSLFDPHGNVYYFKQKGSIKTLYKNKWPLFSFRGFYARLSDIDQKGVVYFIASSHYGSSIYQYKDGQISRNSMSDIISQAIKIDQNQFLACEISDNGYDYKIIPIENIPGEPVFYKYNFQPTSLRSYTPEYEERDFPKQQSENDFYIQEIKKYLNFDNSASSLEDKKNPRQPDSTASPSPTDSKTPALKYKKYNPWTNIRFSSFGFSGGPIYIIPEERTSWKLKAFISFEDYLGKNSILMAYENVDLWRNAAYIGYLNRMYRMTFGGGYAYNWILDSRINTAQLKLSHYVHHINFLMSYPLFERGRWSSGVALKTYYHRNEALPHDHPSVRYFYKNIFKKIQNYYIRDTLEFVGIWGVTYAKKHPFNYTYNRFSSFNVAARYSQDVYNDLDEFRWEASLLNTFHLGSDFYLSLNLYHFSILMGGLNPIVSLVRNYPENFLLKEEVQDPSDTVSFSLVKYFTRQALYSTDMSTASATLRKAFHTPFYFSSFPISVTRTIPLVNFKYLLIDNHRNFRRDFVTLPSQRDYTDIAEWNAGFEIEFLIAYNVLITAALTFGEAYPLERSLFDNEYYLQLNFKKSL